jgi:hypothetical protein
MLTEEGFQLLVGIPTWSHLGTLEIPCPVGLLYMPVDSEGKPLHFFEPQLPFGKMEDQ